jgi:hypothetical protein
MHNFARCIQFEAPRGQNKSEPTPCSFPVLVEMRRQLSKNARLTCRECNVCVHEWLKILIADGMVADEEVDW